MEFLDKTPQGKSFERLVELAQEALPGNIRYEVLEDTLRHLAGTHITAKLLDDTCWRLAGNTKRLAQRRAVPPWHGQKVPEWVPAQIVSCVLSRNQRGHLGADFGFRVIAGTSCPRVITKWWSVKQCRFYSTEFGWSRPKGSNHAPPKYPFSAPAQLVGLRCYLLVTPKLSAQEPGFLIPGFTAAIRQYNANIIKLRLRSGGRQFACPKGFPAEFPCHQCQFGFVTCKAATHRHDWVQKPCEGCGDSEAWFDPERPGKDCVGCSIRKVYKRTLN